MVVWGGAVWWWCGEGLFGDGVVGEGRFGGASNSTPPHNNKKTIS